MATMLDWALAYAGLGWPVFPLASDGKRPALKGIGLYQATTEENQIKEWWEGKDYNIAFSIPEDMVVIDVDDPGLWIGSGFAERLGEAPSSKTKKGAHAFFALDDPEVLRGKKTTYLYHIGIELRTHGAYVVLPPSEHPQGGRYEWHTDPFKEGLPVIDSSLIEEMLESAPDPQIDLPPEANKDSQVTSFLQLGTQESGTDQVPGRNTSLFALASSLRARDFAYHDALEILKSVNQVKCSPPLPDHEVTRSLSSAWRYQAGTLVQGQEQISPEGWVSWDDILEHDYPEPRWFVDEILPSGVLLLAGAPKSGKTYLAYNLATALGVKTIKTQHGETGGWFLSRYKRASSKPFKVGYCDMEESYPEMKERIMGVVSHGRGGNIFSREHMPRLDRGGMDMLWKFNEEGFDAIFLDVWERVRPSGRGGNAYQADYDALVQLNEYVKATNMLLVLVHHDRKGDHLKAEGRDVFQDISGSQAMLGSANIAWLLKRPRGQNFGTIHTTGRRVPEEQINVRWEYDDLQWKYSGEWQG